MPHFDVLIIGDDIEKQLAPFQSNNMGDCPQEYLEFYDIEDECFKEYQTNSKTMVKGPNDGRDERTGRFGYWENPNTKWDWYQVGGMFAGELKLKNGMNGYAYPNFCLGNNCK